MEIIIEFNPICNLPSIFNAMKPQKYGNLNQYYHSNKIFQYKMTTKLLQGPTTIKKT